MLRLSNTRRKCSAMKKTMDKMLNETPKDKDTILIQGLHDSEDKSIQVQIFVGRIEDFVRLTTLFSVRLAASGHRGADLVKLFRQAAVHIVRRGVSTPDEISARNSAKEDATKNTLFLHIDYHPRGIQRKQIRSLYDRHLRGNLPDSFENMVVAVSRPQNIRNACVSNKFECEDIAHKVSDIWGPAPHWV